MPDGIATCDVIEQQSAQSITAEELLLSHFSTLQVFLEGVIRRNVQACSKVPDVLTEISPA